MKISKERDFKQEILKKLLAKYYKRQVKYGKIKSNRRIMLKITEVYRDYEKTSCDLQLKAEVETAAKDLKKQQFVELDYLIYSEDIVKIYLNEEQLIQAERYLQEQYGR